MAELPSGTITLLFTDIEGSTRLLRRLGDRYPAVLEDHRRLVRATVERWRGREVDTQGDGFFVAFPRAADAVAAAVEAQRSLAAHPWPDGAAVRVRMALHTGEPTSTRDGYIGLDVHRAARLCAAGHGGQVLLSEATRSLIEQSLPPGVGLRDLGEHRLKDLQQPEHAFQLVIPELPADFPALRSIDGFPNNLPRQLTSFVGWEREVAAVGRLLGATPLLADRRVQDAAGPPGRVRPGGSLCRRGLACGAGAARGPGARAPRGGRGAGAGRGAPAAARGDASRLPPAAVHAVGAGQLRAPGRCLRRRISAGLSPAGANTRARILLKSDQAPGGPAQSAAAIAAALAVSVPTVERVRRRFAEDGLEAVLHRRPSRREYRRKLDGEAEAHLVALSYSPPPAGRRFWTFKLLADRIVELRFVDGISYETVRRVLKKTRSSPG